MGAETASVIIPTYNRAGYLKEALESALAQDYPNLEVIVVDDGSTDNTEELIKPYLGRIKYIKQKNSGPAKARNNGITSCKGDFITFLDSDDKYLPRKVRLQVEYLKSQPQYGMVYCGCEYFDDSGKCWKPDIKRYSGWIFDKLLFKDFFGSGSCVMIRRNVLEGAGLFNERLITGEDRNLYLKIAKLYQVGFVDEPLVRVRMHAKRLSYNYNVALGTVDGIKDIIGLYPEYDPKKSGLMRNALAERTIKLAEELFYAGKYELGKKYFWESSGYNPAHLFKLKYLCYALTPVFITEFVRRRARVKV